MTEQQVREQTMQTSTEWAPIPHDEHAYHAYLVRLQTRFTGLLEGSIFVTDATGLFATYLAALPAEIRQHHNCNACRRFVDRFGGLVNIDADGQTLSLLWSEGDAPVEIQPGIRAVRRAVESARVTGVFFSSFNVWGEPVTGEWRHLAVTPPSPWVFRKATQTAQQAMAEKREDFKNVQVALREFPESAIDTAIALLQTDSLYRSEKCLGPATWFRNLHQARARTLNNRLRENVTWRAIAGAPTGYCHPRSSMIGTLLEDIIAGLPYEEVARKFAAKMNPTKYQRPQAAPAAGNIAQAEKIIEQTGAAHSLERRFARLDELVTLWRPPAPSPSVARSSGGVFSHLQPRGADSAPPSMRIPTKTITWAKFAREVLPSAVGLEVLVPSVGNFAAYVTATHADAPPILQWDSVDRRNPVSSYVYHRGSSAERWGLLVGEYRAVTAISAHPAQWHGQSSHHGESVTFILDGARDSGYQGLGLGLFPETLCSEFHSIRSTIEAYSKSRDLTGYEEASACGLRMEKGWEHGVTVRVHAGPTTLDYLLDRWD